MTHKWKTKVCISCGKEYRPTGGHQRYCVDCGRTQEKLGKKLSCVRCRKKDPEKHNLWGAKWRENNREKDRLCHVKYRRDNPGLKEKDRLRYAAWTRKYPLGPKEKDAKYRRSHPENNSVKKSKRRALKNINTPPNEMLTSAEWLAILAEHHGHCHYCGKEAKLTLDHVIPLSKGGKHSKDNVVPACTHCNSSKGAKTPKQWRGL